MHIATIVTHLMPMAFLAFTLVDLDDELRRNIEGEIRDREPSLDDQAVHELSLQAVQKKNHYIKRNPTGVPSQISVEDGQGNLREYILVNEIVDGEQRISLEDVTDSDAA